MAASNKFDGLDVGFRRTSYESIQFCSVCLALFISVSNSTKIQYKLLAEYIPVLNNFFLIVWLSTVRAAGAAAIQFNTTSVRARYIHRKRYFRIEQSLATGLSSRSNKATSGKERDLVIIIVILQLETLEELLKTDNSQTGRKKMKFKIYKERV
jgi:hypothetical protein